MVKKSTVVSTDHRKDGSKGGYDNESMPLLTSPRPSKRRERRYGDINELHRKARQK